MRALRALGQAKHVDGAMDAGLGGLHRVVLVVHRRGRAGKVVDLLDLDVQRKRDIVAHQLEGRMADKVADVVLGPREEVIHAEDVVPSFNQAVAQVRPKESCAAGHQNLAQTLLHEQS